MSSLQSCRKEKRFRCFLLILRNNTFVAVLFFYLLLLQVSVSIGCHLRPSVSQVLLGVFFFFFLGFSFNRLSFEAVLSQFLFGPINCSDHLTPQTSLDPIFLFLVIVSSSLSSSPGTEFLFGPINCSDHLTPQTSLDPIFLFLVIVSGHRHHSFCYFLLSSQTVLTCDSLLS